MNPNLEPVIISEISVTERAEFRQCRRKWFLSTVHRLETRGGASYFWFGSLGHFALENYYRALMRGGTIPQAEARARRAYAKFVQDTLPDIRNAYGPAWEYASQEYDDMIAMGEAILEGYFEEERDTGGMGKVIAVERRFMVPILNEDGQRIKGAFLSGRFDLVVRRPNKKEWVIDHKFLGSRHNSSFLDVDDQLTGYAYVWWRVTGTMPEGEVYNVLLKKAPAPPKLIRNGQALSVDKSQSTTYRLFLQAIKENGFSVADYEEHLEYLKTRGWTDFYVQEGVFRNARQLQVFEDNLIHEWRDMRRVAANPELAYPNPSSFNCPGCPVKLICQTMQDKGDVDAVIANQFQVGAERR